MGARDFVGETPEAREYEYSARDFERVRAMIYARAGIHLNESKQNMVYSRLSRRLRTCSLQSFAEYLDRLENDARFDTLERQEFINALTTNLTSFFREAHHFPVLAEFLAAPGLSRPAKLWCAAASTGEEPYSIAITIAESGTAAQLLATDIDTHVLATAERGVYRMEAAQACGEQRLRKHFLRGAGANSGMVRVKPEITRLVQFAQANLLDQGWPVVERFSTHVDAVFCRNVMIYFDRETQRRILGRIARVLRPGGLLFVGHSENFTDCRELFSLRGKTVYRRL